MSNCSILFLYGRISKTFHFVLFIWGWCMGEGEGVVLSNDSYLKSIPPSTFIWCVPSRQQTNRQNKNWTLNLTWGWRSEQARGGSLNKAWPWLHTTLFVPCIINVNSECCTVNTWMDFLEKAALASFSAHVHIYKYIYIYIW